MELLFTEFKKGRAKFEKMFSSGVINPAGFKEVIGKSMVEEILSNGSSRELDQLDVVGEHFRKSWRTRSTGHKEFDFSTIQAKSSSALQAFYMRMAKAWTQLQVQKQKSAADGAIMVPLTDAAVDPNFVKGILPIHKKINKAKKDLMNTIKSDPIMYAKLKEECDKIKSGTTPPSEVVKDYDALLDQLNSKGTAYVNEKTKEIVKDTLNFSEALFWGGYAGYLAGSIETEIMCFALPAAVLASDLALGALLAPVGMGVGIFVVLGLAALALYVAHETGIAGRLAKIKAKKFEIKVQEKLKSFIKYNNEASRWAVDYSKKHASGSKDVTFGENPVPKEIADVVVRFVSSQHDLWVPYTTPAGRKYDESLKAAHGKHWSGLRKVRDTKQDTEIGAAKLALSNVWSKMAVAL